MYIFLNANCKICNLNLLRGLQLKLVFMNAAELICNDSIITANRA